MMTQVVSDEYLCPCGEPTVPGEEECATCLEEHAAWDGDVWDEDFPIDGVGFADPGGRSALRAETPGNPRNLPCPTCGTPNRLTPLDVAAGYQCDACADSAEGCGS